VSATQDTVDVVVVGAGFGGLYALHKFRQQGRSVRVFEAAPEVGGTWYFNRYPGARCDVESLDYCYSFSDELQQEWTWTEKYATQPEILSYIKWVADRLNLRSGITFDTRVVSAVLDEDTLRWAVTTDTGETVIARFVVMATGPLSSPLTPNINGLDSFGGKVYHTAHWPHEGVDFTGKRVAVIGTGSSGIQSIPIIAEQATQLYVLQRTPNYSVPAGNRKLDFDEIKHAKATYDERRRMSWRSGGGSPHVAHPKMTMEASPEERREAFEKRWQLGGVLFSKTFTDQMINMDANDEARKFYEEKVRAVIDDPDVADLLIPDDHPIGTKRICTDTNYFETYNRDNVTLVDIRHAPIQEITPTGIRTEDGDYELDIIVFATGFDAMTGTFNRIDIEGRNGEKLKDKWAHGPLTYLGVATAGYPNLFMITGPGSPSVLSNMPVSIEQHVEWISGAIEHMREQGLDVMEADPDAETEWVAHVNDVAAQTMFMLADSWYLGANIPGKPRVFMPYPGGVGPYRQKCNEVTEAGYAGFTFSAVEAARN
jgi:cation diffusion facilitator CzcD-associated flavoprotein CzcO